MCEELWHRFYQELQKVHGTCFFADSAEQCATYLKGIALREETDEILKSHLRLNSEPLIVQSLSKAGIRVVECSLSDQTSRLRERTEGASASHDVYKESVLYLRNKIKGCKVALTGAKLAISNTGSVLIVENSGCGRFLITLPGVHIVIIESNKIVHDLIDAFRVLRQEYGGRLPGYVVCITGPSRTADIEQVLTVGAHGPRELHVIVLKR
jgi:L-lactate utilization protein LutB